MRLHRFSNRGQDDRHEDGFRGWATLYTDDERELAEAHVQITTRWRNGTGVSLKIGDGTNVALTVTAPRIFIHVSAAALPLRRLLGPLFRPARLGYDSRETSISWRAGALWVDLWSPKYASTRSHRWPNAWFNRGRRRRTTRPEPCGGCWPWATGHEFHFDPVDALLGRRRCTTSRGEPFDVVVPMPEGNYPATVTPEHRVWRRPRWPFVVQRRSDFDLTMKVGIPFPGKGENSWDCGDDAIMGTGGTTAEEAIVRAVSSALRNRERYGPGARYVPADGWPPLPADGAKGGLDAE